MERTMLQVKNIHKSFNGTEVLQGLDLELCEGEVLAVIGPSGSGKSTFLRCIVRLERIDSGEIILEGDTMVSTDENGAVHYAPESSIRAIRRKMGMVFQDFNLFPHLNVTQNLAIAPVRVLREDKQAAAEKAHALLEKVGLGDKKNSYPYELSGGQKQRVAIARALAMEPDILCFDEPTSALDPELTGEVLKVIQDLAADNMTMIVVTHEMGFAREVADRVVFMDGGRIIEQGLPKDILLNPQTQRMQDFLAQVLHMR
ncbi:MAG: amino acid ABC transporter ATP-binding protein [Bacillota bacterium]